MSPLSKARKNDIKTKLKKMGRSTASVNALKLDNEKDVIIMACNLTGLNVEDYKRRLR